MLTLKPKIYTGKVITVTPSTSVYEAARLMREHHVGDVVVVESQKSQKPVGILTDRDIVVEVIAEKLEAKALTVGDIMTSDVVLGRENAPMYEWITQMRTHGIRRLPIVDNKENLKGVVSFDNILEMVGLELSGLAKLGSKQRKTERTLRQYTHG